MCAEDRLCAEDPPRAGDVSRGRDSAAAVVVCPNGPLLVRGDFEILTPAGEPLPRQRGTVALCRCGASAIRPYCDGTHKLIGFRAEGPGSGEPPEPNP